MPYIGYPPQNRAKYKPWKLAMIAQANEILSEYTAKGYKLTLRGLYYKFVARDLFPASWADPKTGSTNNVKSYDKFGVVVNDARLSGKMDWNAIEDRTRSLSGSSHWSNPAEVVDSAYRWFLRDKWEDQPYRVELWVEKDAMKGVIGSAATKLDINYFSCRGYTSSSEMWGAAQRLIRYVRGGQKVLILHLGDHDPSGCDMSRDIEDRIRKFMGLEGCDFEFKRIALTLKQIKAFNPPPAPAKITDSRGAGYIAEYGEDSWELDALEPEAVEAMITEEVLAVRDEELFAAALKVEARMKAELKTVSTKWDKVAELFKFEEATPEISDEIREWAKEMADDYIYGFGNPEAFPPTDEEVTQIAAGLQRLGEAGILIHESDTRDLLTNGNARRELGRIDGYRQLEDALDSIRVRWDRAGEEDEEEDED